MKQSLFTLILIYIQFFVFADEGMIIPALLKAYESDMQAKGMKLSACEE